MLARHVLAGATLGAGALLALAGPAAAHITPSERSAPAGSYLTFDLRVPHGCEEAGTTKIEVQIPEDITSVTPQVVPGWAISRTQEQLDPPLDDGHGGQITERTAVVTWEGGPLAHDQLEEFGLSVKLPATPGETIYFPVIQTCEDGSSTDWIQLPDPSGEEPEHPAPAIELTEASGDEHGDTAETVAASSTSDDDSDDGDGLAIAGIVVGALGLLTAGAALARTRRTS